MLRNTLFFAASLWYLSSCTACFDKKGDDKSVLLFGHWTVVSATRGGQPTTLLNGTWLEFDKNGEMDTNLQMLEGKTAFVLDKNTLRKEGRVPVDFTILSLTDSTISLSFEIRSKQFEINLVRSEAQSNPTDITPTEEPAPIQPEESTQIYPTDQ